MVGFHLILSKSLLTLQISPLVLQRMIQLRWSFLTATLNEVLSAPCKQYQYYFLTNESIVLRPSITASLMALRMSASAYLFRAWVERTTSKRTQMTCFRFMSFWKCLQLITPLFYFPIRPFFDTLSIQKIAVSFSILQNKQKLEYCDCPYQQDSIYPS